MLSNTKIEIIYEPLSKIWNSLNTEIEQLEKQKYDMLGLTEYYDELDQIYKHCKFSKECSCHTTLTRPNTAVICDRYAVEVAEIDVKVCELKSKSKIIWNEMTDLFKINDNNSKYKRTSKIARQKLEKELCSICYEQHNISKIITLDCGHSLGKQCFEQLMDHNYDAYIDNTCCPLCRHVPREITRYKK
jgi:hypothetical protein